jgi:hypothetical protein
MQPKTQPRAASFLLVMSWIYILLALGMVGISIYQLTNAETQLTFRVATESVFLLIGGVFGLVAGIFGLVSKNLKRCRLIGLIILAVAAVPLIINWIAGDSFSLYWKNVVAIVLPFLYLLAALVKRSEKKPEAYAAPAAQPATVDESRYAAPAPKPVSAPAAQTVAAPATQSAPQSETEKSPEILP